MERRRKQKSNRASQDSRPLIPVYNRQRALSIQPASVRRLVLLIVQQKKMECDKISVYFVGVRKSAELHKKFFNDPTPTDCMTFPINSSFLGECVICPSVALQVNPLHPYEEISHYLIHCLLHLIGYDDIDKKKKAAMRKEELKLLALARKQGCLLEA